MTEPTAQDIQDIKDEKCREDAQERDSCRHCGFDLNNPDEDCPDCGGEQF